MTFGHVGREYPNVLMHVLNGPEDARTPSELHPIFYGSYDWHSCVHGWWQLLRLIRHYPDLEAAPAIRARADAMFVPDKVAGELAYLERPGAAGSSVPMAGPGCWRCMTRRAAMTRAGPGCWSRSPGFSRAVSPTSCRV